MTGLERHHRNAKIVALRKARVPWKEVASQFGMTVRGAERIVEMWHDSAVDFEVDTRDHFEELIAGLTMAIEQFAIIGVTGDGDSNRIGALKAYVETLMARDDVLRTAGLLPRHRAAPRLEDEMQVMFREFADLLGRHGVGEDALMELVELAQSRQGQWTAAPRRQLPHAA